MAELLRSGRYADEIMAEVAAAGVAMSPPRTRGRQLPTGRAGRRSRRGKKPVLHRTFPVVQQIPTYRGKPFAANLTAGLTVGALAIPSSMAYAELIGVPPVYGLYVLLLPLVVYAASGRRAR